MSTHKPLICIVTLMLLAPHTAHGYGSEAHRLCTQKAFQVFASSGATAFDTCMSPDLRCAEIDNARTREPSFYQLRPSEMVVAETPAVDDYRDMEFVDVEGGIGNGGRDNPHKDELGAIDDSANTGRGSMSFTAFNHFIDIRTGPGVFDDYDGYSYKNGSGSKDQYQMAASVATSWGEKLAADVTSFKVDEAVNWWFNDEYVHVSGQRWYNGCSPAVERYSFFQDKSRYTNKEAELAARFPLANAVGTAGRGMPYSVFMPVDNMARYWYGRFLETGDVLCLAPVMHAIQDASIPHHAAGCLGNWHSQYEDGLERTMDGWVADTEFTREVKLLVAEWNRSDPSPPSTLKPGDWAKIPSIDWSVDQLVTWVALNAYEEYRGTYQGFKKGYHLNDASTKRLARLATAMSALVMRKAIASKPTPIRPHS